MKIFFKSLCIGMVVAVLFTLVPFECQCREISDKVFRVHILANSDSDIDQALKLKVRDAVIAKAETFLCNAHSKDEAKTLVAENLSLLADTAAKVIRSEGFDYPVEASIKRVRFNTRYYGDITMPGGVYDALQLRIGKAQGKNWWCVMYPSLCIYAASDSDTMKNQLTPSEYDIVTSDKKFEFRLKTVEIFSKICEFFSR